MTKIELLKKSKEIKMKEYVTPGIEFWYLEAKSDIVMASDPNDNNYSDIDWGE